MPHSLRTNYPVDFESKLSDIEKLVATPDLIKQACIQVLDSALAVEGLGLLVKQKLTSGRGVIANISDDSIAKNYAVIYSQMCVLAVSAVEEALKRYFENVANDSRRLSRSNSRLTEIKVSLEDLLDEDLRYGGKVGALILKKARPSFQDLKSIKHTFKQYFDKEIVLQGEVEKDACFYFEVRHCLVHNSGRVDQKFVTATSVLDANRYSWTVDDPVNLGEEDWKALKLAFTALIAEVTKPIDQ